jgi:O-succinylbenzoic acid--CoA ligase
VAGRLRAIEDPGGPSFVDALTRTWDDGDAAFPVDPRLPPAARASLLAAMRVGEPVEPGDALVVATSGSTGAPKGVVLTHDAVRASALATSARLGVTTDDHWLACLPLAHVGGLSVVTRALLTGTQLTVLERFDAADVDHSDATLVSLVPTALRRIDASRFRWIVLGGSRPPEHLPGNVVSTYGLTETGSGVVYDGVPLDDVDVRLDGGEILLRGPMLLRTYRDGHDPKDADGWLRTGDLGRWLPDGRLHVDGRAGDLIITGGENVWPDPVEAALATHPAVADAAVWGPADPEWGQVVAARIVVRPDAVRPTLDALRDHVKTTLPAFMAPRRIDVVDRIDRTALGKIRRTPFTEEPT